MATHSQKSPGNDKSTSKKNKTGRTTSRKRLLKKPVSFSLDDAQLAKIDNRAAQSGLNRSSQLQHDLATYWFLISEGLEQIKKILSSDDAHYIAQIFRGRLLSASEEITWCKGQLSEYIRESKRYGNPQRAEDIAVKIDRCNFFSRLGLLDWIRRAAMHTQDESFYTGWTGKDAAY